MKKIISIFGLLLLIGASLVWGKQLFSVNAKFMDPKSGDEKVLLVQDFWQEALKQGDVGNYITPTPSEFYNESPRCSVEDPNNKSQEIKMTLQPKEDGFTRGLRKTAREIGEGKFALVNVKIFRQWEKEAIVDVRFSRTGDPNLTENRFFLLIFVEGKWKIFMDTGAPDLLNKEYAKSSCSK